MDSIQIVLPKVVTAEYFSSGCSTKKCSENCYLTTELKRVVMNSYGDILLLRQSYPKHYRFWVVIAMMLVHISVIKYVLIRTMC